MLAQKFKFLELQTLTRYLFLFLILALPAVVLSPPPPQLLLIDFPEFYVTARMMAAGQGFQIYNIPVLRNLQTSIFGANHFVPLYIPPFASWLLTPLSLLPEQFAPQIWMGILIAFVLLSLYLLQKAFALSHRALLWITVIVSLSGPEWESIRHGQLAPILLFAISSACFALKRKNTLVAALSLSLLLLKPQILLPIGIYILAAGQYRLLALLASFSGIFLLVSLFTVGIQGYIDYFALGTYSLLQRQWMAPELCPTIRGQLLRFLPKEDFLVLVISAVALCTALLIIWFIAQRYKNEKENWFDFCLIGAVPLGLLTSLHCHNYDLLILLPTLIAIKSSGIYKQVPQTFLWLSIAAGGICMLPFYTLIHYSYLLVGGILNPLFILLSLFAIGTVTLLIKKQS